APGGRVATGTRSPLSRTMPTTVTVVCSSHELGPSAIVAAHATTGTGSPTWTPRAAAVRSVSCTSSAAPLAGSRPCTNSGLSIAPSSATRTWAIVWLDVPSRPTACTAAADVTRPDSTPGSAMRARYAVRLVSRAKQGVTSLDGSDPGGQTIAMPLGAWAAA